MPEVQIQQVYDTVRIPINEESYDLMQDGNILNLEGIQYQHYLNCFPTVAKDEIKGGGDVWVSKRNGFFDYVDISSMLPSSTSNWAVDNISFSQLTDTYVAAIFDNTFSKHVIVAYSVTSGIVKVGEITGTQAGDFVFLSELNVGNVPYLGVIWQDNSGATTGAGYYAPTSTLTFTFTASSLVKITSATFPPNNVSAPGYLIGPMIQMDGTTYVLTTDGAISGSDLNTITTWNPLNVIRAIQYPDRGVCLARYKNFILCFGEDSTEFFSDVGNPAPASPLERTQQASIKFGAAGSRGVVTVDDAVYWLGSSHTGNSGLWTLNGYTPVKLSSNKEDNLMGLGVSELRSAIFMNNQCLVTDCLVRLGVENVINTFAATYVDGVATPSALVGDPTGDFNDEFNNTLLSYNIDSKSWWLFKHPYSSKLVNNSFLPICASRVSAYRTTTTQNYTYTLFKNINNGFTIEPVAHHIYVLLSASQGIGKYQDEYVSGTGLSFNPITCSIGFNTQNFNNEKRKRIHKLKVIQRIIETDSLFTYPYIWVAYTKDDWVMDQDSAGNRRIFVRSISTSRDKIRYYLNNLGSGRQWGLCLINKSDVSWQVKALELDISQGTR